MNTLTIMFPPAGGGDRAYEAMSAVIGPLHDYVQMLERVAEVTSTPTRLTSYDAPSLTVRVTLPGFAHDAIWRRWFFKYRPVRRTRLWLGDRLHRKKADTTGDS